MHQQSDGYTFQDNQASVWKGWRNGQKDSVCFEGSQETAADLCKRPAKAFCEGYSRYN